jgi:hypothetical protein
MEQTRPTSRLIVNGQFGALIQIFDDDLRLCGQGTERLELVLPEGIYRVVWTGHTQRQQLVRLLPIERPFEIPVDVSSEGPAVSASIDAVFSASTIGPSEAESEIVVILRAQPDAEGPTYTAGVKLFDIGESEVNPVPEHDLNLKLEPKRDCVIRSYRVTPGTYHLRYEVLSGGTVEQSVSAMQGRRTIAFLKAQPGEVLQADQGEFRHVQSNGVVVGATTILSIGRYDQKDVAVTQPAIMNLLTHLANGRAVVGPQLRELLSQPHTDPYLRLYAAAAVIAQIDAGGSPDPSEAWPDAPELQDTARTVWLTWVKTWIRSLISLEGAPPDVLSMLWQLGSQKALTAIRFPPHCRRRPCWPEPGPGPSPNLSGVRKLFRIRHPFGRSGGIRAERPLGYPGRPPRRKAEPRSRVRLWPWKTPSKPSWTPRNRLFKRVAMNPP